MMRTAPVGDQLMAWIGTTENYATFLFHDLPNPAIRSEGRDRVRHDQSSRQAQRAQRSSDERAWRCRGAHRDGVGDQGGDPHRFGTKVIRRRRRYRRFVQAGALRWQGAGAARPVRAAPSRDLRQAGDRRDQRIRAGRRLRAGDGLSHPDRQREREVRPARGQARHRAGLRRHATTAPARGQGGGPAAHSLGRNDRCAGSLSNRTREQGRASGRSAHRIREDDAGYPRDGPPRRAAGDGGRGSGVGNEPRRGAAARGESLWLAGSHAGHERRVDRISRKARRQISGTLSLLLWAACLGDRERPGPPQLSFTIDDPLVVSSRQDTVAGEIRVEDRDGVDSVWITLDTFEKGDNGGFNQVFASRYRFVVQGFNPSQQIPLSFRARDISGFEVQRDTYVVVIP